MTGLLQNILKNVQPMCKRKNIADTHNEALKEAE